jgi:transposase
MNITKIIQETVREELAKAGVVAPQRRKIYTVAEVSNMLAVSKELIYKMIDAGKIQAIDLSAVPSQSMQDAVKKAKKGELEAPKKRHKRSFRISESEINRLTQARTIGQK